MTQNILIEFTSDAEGLQSGIDQLENLGKVDSQLADSFKKTNAAIKQQQDVLSSTDSSIKTFAQNISKADKAAAGAFGSKVIADFEKNVAKTNLTSAKLVQTISALEKQQQKLGQAKVNNALNPDLVKQYSDAIEKTNEQLKELYAELDALQASGKVFDEMGNEVENTNNKTQTFKARLRELKNELQQLETAGQGDSEQFRQMSIEAARLEDQIGDTNQQIRILASDTFKFDAVLGGVQGVTTAFGLAQSASALLGDQNEDLQKTLVKINAVMQISQSLQQLDNFLKGESAAKEAVKIAVQKIAILNQQLDNAATSESIVIRYAAAAAQWVLNAAMAANPGVLLLAVIGAIAGALLYFTSGTKDAEKAQNEFNNTMRESTEVLEAGLRAYDTYSKRKLALLKQQGASDRDVAKEEFDNIQRNLAERVKALDRVNKTIDSKNAKEHLSAEDYKKLLEKKADLETKIDDDYTALLSARSDNIRKSYLEELKSFEALADAKVLAQKKGSIEELQAQEEAAKAAAKVAVDSNPNLTAGEKIKIQAELNRKLLELDNQIQNKRLENQVYLANAAVVNAENGSARELELKKVVLQKQLALDLNQLGISEAKKAEIRAKEKEEQQQLDKEIALNEIATRVSVNNTALANVQEGSKEELNLKLNGLKLERDAALINSGNINTKKEEAEAEYLKKVRELNKQYNYQVVQDTINTRINGLATQIAPLEIQADAATNTELLSLKKSMLDEQAALEVENAKNTIANAELRASKIKAIEAKLSADKIALEKTTNAAIIEQNKNEAQSQTKDEIQAQERILNSSKSTNLEKIAAAKEITRLKKELLEEEITAENARFVKGVDSEKEHQLKIAELKRQERQLDYDETQKLEQKKKELRQKIVEETFKIGQQISDAIFEADAANRQAQLDASLTALDAAKAKEVDNKNLTEQQKADIDAKYKAKEKKIKQEAAKRDRDAQVNQAIVNGALAITNILATMPKFDFGVASAIAIAAAIASTAVQVAKIKSTPLPGLFRGTKNAKPGYYRLGELGQEMMVTKEGKLQMFGERREEVGYIPEGAKVYTAKETADILKGVPSMAIPSIELPDMAPLPKWAEMQLSMHNQTLPQIDYEKIGLEFARHVGKISDIPGVDVIIDEDGISIASQKGNARTQYNNKRYSIR